MTTWFTRIGLLVALFAGGAVFAHPHISQATLVGTADLIVVGKVAAVQEVPGTMARTPGCISLTSGKGVATLAIEQTLKGPVLKTAAIAYPTPPKKRWMDGCFNLKVGARHLFVLSGENGTYRVVRTPHDVKEVDAFRKLLANLPEITLDVPGIITLHPAEKMVITITNRTSKAIDLFVGSIRLTCRYGQNENLDLDLLMLTETLPLFETLKPGESWTTTTGVMTSLPPKLILAQARIHAQFTYQAADTRSDSAPVTVASPPVTTLISPYEPAFGINNPP